MKPLLMLLPFFSLLVAAIGSSAATAFSEVSWISPVTWSLTIALLALWVFADFKGFKKVFSRKGARYGASSGVVVVLGTTIIVMVAFLSNRPRFDKTFDTTKAQINTLSDQSLKIAKKIANQDVPVKITTFFVDEESKDSFKRLIRLYETSGAKLEIEYLSPHKDLMRAKSENITSANTAIIRRGSLETRVTAFNEEKITNAFVNVLKENTKKVYFTKGHGEGELKSSEPNGFDFVSQTLENNKYTVAELNLLEEAKVPEDADLVVIGGPKYDFKEEEIRFLDAYLSKGGALMVMVDAAVPVQKLNAFVNDYGINFGSDFLILPPNDPRAMIFGQEFAIITEFDSMHPVSKDFARQSQVNLLIPNTRTLSEVKDNKHKLKVTLAAKTSEVVVKVKGVESESDLAEITEDRIEQGSFPVLAVAVGKVMAPQTADSGTTEEAVKSDAGKPETTPSDKEMRLVAVGSSIFAQNRAAQSSAANVDLFTNISNYLLQDEDFISIRPKDAEAAVLDIASGTSMILLTFISFLYPLMFLSGGMIYWVRRKNA